MTALADQESVGHEIRTSVVRLLQPYPLKAWQAGHAAKFLRIYAAVNTSSSIEALQGLSKSMYGIFKVISARYRHE